MKYKGGKGASGVHQQIINKMPIHNTYIETHLGGGNIILRKKPAINNIAIEIDKKVLNNFKRYSISHFKDTISFINDDCIDFLMNYDFKGNELIYSDPPYLFETRKNKKNLYKYEYTMEDHIKLLNTLNSLNCFVMISGYESSLYNEMLHHNKWFKYTFNAMTRSGVRTEVLWCNFNPDLYIKHDYKYIGSNFRQREQIKKKTSNIIKKLNKLNNDERNFILSNIVLNFKHEIHHHFLAANII